jgi:LuxR family maltose regulon positive regulatory protein
MSSNADSQGIPLLRTKLHTPQVRAELVSRPHLIERLDEAIRSGRKLTLVSAPAGFGKTTLVSEWLQQGALPFGWLSLDEGDNDPVRFLIHLVAALQCVHPDWGRATREVLGSSELPAPTRLITALINEVAAGAVQFILVLDDYHLISTPSIHEMLGFALEHMPRQMHLAMLARADPPLSLSRLRACGDLAEIRADDLRFTPEEARRLLVETMRLDLTPQQAAVLAHRTEGWAAGLQLAALSLQRITRHEDIAGFIHAFAGSHRYVMDYLIEEVFDRQSPDVQAFLLQTSVLNRLCGPLCDALIEQEGGQKMLEHLDRANLFTVPLDHARHWYRYHRLFADLLRDRLQQTQPGIVPELHRRASIWYEDADLIDEAFAHAVGAGDVRRATRLAEAQAERLVQRGEVSTLLRWLKALPDEAIRSHPRLCVSYAWALFLTGQAGTLEPWLQDAEMALTQQAALPAPPGDKPDLAPLQGEVDILRLASARYHEAPSRVIERGQQTLDQVDEDDPFTRGLVYLSLGTAYRLCGDMDAAIHACTEAARLCWAAGNTMAAMLATYDLSRLYGFQGQLALAAETCQRVLDSDRGAGLVARRSPCVGLAHLGLARVQYEWDELETAEHHTREGIALGEPGGSLVLLMRGYTLLARIRQAHRDVRGVRAAIRTLEQAIRQRDLLPTTVDELATYRALFDLMQGDLEAAARWAKTVQPNPQDRLDTLREFQWLTLVRVLIAQGRSDEAAPLLARLLHAAESQGRTGRAIQILTLQALARQADGETFEALVVLGSALALAEAEGYVRTFLDEGRPMTALLSEILVRSHDLSGKAEREGGQTLEGVSPAYIKRLLAASGRPPAAEWLVEPLTARELEVLRLIAAGLKNREIAERLVISVATVKRHITNLYGKLGVSRRTQAIARAQALGLVRLEDPLDEGSF